MYQEDHRNVQQECNKGIGQEREYADTVYVAHSHTWDLDDHGDHAVDNGAGRGVVIQGDKGVHLEFGGAQHALDHDETEGLENDTTALV